MIGVIYKYTSPSNKIYIGQTVREKVRHNEFLNIKKDYAGSIINKARIKYGPENFKYEILLIVKTNTVEYIKRELDFWEKYYIKYFKSQNYILYNLTDGGDEGTLGYKHTDESKNKIAENRIGKKHSNETRKKMSKSQKGKHSGKRPKEWYKNRKSRKGKSNEWLKKKVSCIDPKTGLVVKIYDSIKEAAFAVGAGESSIRNAIKGNCKTIKGYIWNKLC